MTHRPQCIKSQVVGIGIHAIYGFSHLFEQSVMGTEKYVLANFFQPVFQLLKRYALINLIDLAALLGLSVHI